MHHGAEAHGAKLLHLNVILLLHILCHLPVAVLKSAPDILQCIRPDPVLQPVLPVMGPGCDGRIVLIHQHRLDPGGTKLDSKHRFPVNYCLPYIAHETNPPKHIHDPEPLASLRDAFRILCDNDNI